MARWLHAGPVTLQRRINGIAAHALAEVTGFAQVTAKRSLCAPPTCAARRPPLATAAVLATCM
jgi:hypothetical protein